MRVRVWAATAAAVALSFSATTPVLAEPSDPEVTLLATTDVHGHVMNWDYFRDKPFAGDKQGGLSRVATIVDSVRNQATDKDSVLVLDNGDAIQGTPLTYLAAVQQDKLGISSHPMALAYNAIGYDAQVVGNHEYNYGLDLLAKYRSQLNFPLLGANVIDVATGKPAEKPYEIFTRDIDGHTVKIGVLGLVTPGVRTWDKAHVEGKLEFRDIVLTAQKYVPEMKKAGADVVVALAHSGQDADGATWDPAKLGENVARSLATHVNDLDVVIAGHSHVENAQEMFKAPDGDPVLLTQPKFWAQSVSEITLPLKAAGQGWTVDWNKAKSIVHPASEAADSPKITENKELQKAHAATVKYVNTVVAQSTQEMTTATSRYEDTPILDLIGKVMTDSVAKALANKPEGKLPILAQVSPFSRESVFPKGDVTIKDIAGLYIYDNTLGAVKITGKQLKEYLEYSARYFCQTQPGEKFDPEKHTNCKYPGATRGIPDYNFDAVTGVNYQINVSKPVGERIENLTMPDGSAIADDAEFILAVNNYRQNGGGGYPIVKDAPEVWNDLLEIRQLIIEYATAKGVIDPADFYVHNWDLVTESQPAPTPTPTDSTPTAPVPTDPVPTVPGPSAPAPSVPAPTAAPVPLPVTGGEGIALTVLAGGLLASGGLLLRRRYVH